jgi:ferric-dicitrate binding protein FerR (iron transport regulator)
VDIAVLPSCQVRLLGEGELIIDSLIVTKDGNETDDAMMDRRAAVSLNRGTVFVKHRRPPGSFGTLIVRTPSGTINSSSDCLICVEATPQHTRLVCVRGYVEVSPASGRNALTVTAGSIAEVTSQTSSLAEVAADADAQGKVTDTLSVEEELLALTRTRRNILAR